jgi:hypothetical protein
MASNPHALIDTNVEQDFARIYGVWSPDSYTLIDSGASIQAGRTELDVFVAEMLRDPNFHRRGTFPFSFVTPTVYFYGRPLSYEEIGEELSHHTFALIAPSVPHSVLTQLLVRLSEICNPRVRSEDTPSPYSCSTAQRILNEANTIAPIVLEPTVVESSEGDLLIHWDTSMKGVVLICPRNQSPSIYKEILDGVRPTSSQLLTDVSANSLSEALAWVQSPNN